jgi:nucleotide-binding universal stress UspA family protein
MLPLKKIVCPTDFSEPSYKALDASCELAQQFSSELILVHVVSPIPIMPSSEASPSFNIALYLQEMEASAKKSLDEVVKKRIGSDIRVGQLVVQGEPADEIVGVATERQADIIVIATHGRTGWRRFVFGSVAEKVVRLAACPVLTIHTPPEEA